MKYFLYQCIVLVPMYCMALDEINAMSRRNAMKYFMRIFSSGAMHHRRGLERQGGIRYTLQCIGTPSSNIFTDVFRFGCNRWWVIVADNDISVANDHICYVAIDSFVLVAIDKGFWSQMTDSLYQTAILLEDEIAKGYSEDQWRADDGDDQRWTTRKPGIGKYHIQTPVHK